MYQCNDVTARKKFPSRQRSSSDRSSSKKVVKTIRGKNREEGEGREEQSGREIEKKKRGRDEGEENGGANLPEQSL